MRFITSLSRTCGIQNGKTLSTIRRGLGGGIAATRPPFPQTCVSKSHFDPAFAGEKSHNFPGQQWFLILSGLVNQFCLFMFMESVRYIKQTFLIPG
jgi:hypothetical protein